MTEQASPVCMIVEDEALIAMVLEDDFTSAGYEVVGAFATSTEALRWLANDTPDVAVLDTTLKDGSCTELARELKARGVPFLIHSGQDARQEIDPVFQAVPWVPKPALPKALIDAARELTLRPALSDQV